MQGLFINGTHSTIPRPADKGGRRSAVDPLCSTTAKWGGTLGIWPSYYSGCHNASSNRTFARRLLPSFRAHIRVTPGGRTSVSLYLIGAPVFTGNL